MQKFILKNNKRFQILNVLTDLVDVFRPKIFEPGNVRVRTRKKKPCSTVKSRGIVQRTVRDNDFINGKGF